MIKLRDLLKEDDVVKNKKTGNVYVVKQMDPAKHDKPTPAEIEKTKAANGGQLPKGEQPSQKPTPQLPKGQPQKGQKVSASDFKTSAEKPKQQTGNSDDMKLKSLMPGMDTSKKTLSEVPPIQRQKISTVIDDLAKMCLNSKEHQDQDHLQINFQRMKTEKLIPKSSSNKC